MSNSYYTFIETVDVCLREAMEKFEQRNKRYAQLPDNEPKRFIGKEFNKYYPKEIDTIQRTSQQHTY